MLSLPSKPWKKVKIDALGSDQYRITFVSPLADEAEFDESVDEDIASCLAGQDSLGAADWPSRSVVVTTTDLDALKRKLVYASIMVETT